jgi:hypothetical protein
MQVYHVFNQKYTFAVRLNCATNRFVVNFEKESGLFIAQNTCVRHMLRESYPWRKLLSDFQAANLAGINCTSDRTRLS